MWVVWVVWAAWGMWVVRAVYDRAGRESRVRATAFGMPGRAPARACGHVGHTGRAGCAGHVGRAGCVGRVGRVRPRKSYGSCAVVRGPCGSRAVMHRRP